MFCGPETVDVSRDEAELGFSQQVFNVGNVQWCMYRVMFVRCRVAGRILSQGFCQSETPF